MFGVDPRIDRHFPDRPAEHFIRHLLDLGSRDRSPIFNDAELGGDDGSGYGMIAGDHHRAYPCRLRARDGFHGLCAGRVDHADQSCEHEVLLDAPVNVIGFECGCRQRAEGDAERT
jgi:hypothetical protein